MTAAVVRPVSPAPVRTFICAACDQLIPDDRLHFLLDNGQVICGSCVTPPMDTKNRQTVLARVCTYGRRHIIAALLERGTPSRRNRPRPKDAR